MLRARVSAASCPVVDEELRSVSASSSCSTLIACLSAETELAKEREVGRRDWVMVEAEAMLCCEMEDEGKEECGSDDGSGCCEDVVAATGEGKVEVRLRVTVSEAGLSAAEL